tara:strand:+ start:2509 stop:2715 length:207 start_codon:yes stop_codon:yes gene_type:complete
MSAKTFTALEQIETKTSQIKALTIIAQGSNIEELHSENIVHFFNTLTDMANDIQNSLATLSTTLRANQ